MRLVQALWLAFMNLRRRGQRNLLTVIGVFIGIAAVVGFIGLGQGMEYYIDTEFEDLGSNVIFITPGNSVFDITAFTSESIRLTEDDQEAIARAAAVTDVSGLVMGAGSAQYQDQDPGQVFIMGAPTDSDAFQLMLTSLAMDIEDGRYLRPGDNDAVMIGSDVPSALNDDSIGVRSRITIQGRRLRVVGTFQRIGDPGADRAIYLPLGTARDLTGKEDGFDYLLARMSDGVDPDAVAADIERELRRERGLEEGEEDFQVSTAGELIEVFDDIMAAVNGVVVGIAAISLLVGGVGIMNTMFTAVTDRTREIGVMKAVGARRRDIMTVFLLESGMIGLVGGILGVLAGGGMAYAALYAAESVTGIALASPIGLDVIGGALLFSFVVGTISGVLPAQRAASLHPADALRYE